MTLIRPFFLLLIFLPILATAQAITPDTGPQATSLVPVRIRIETVPSGLTVVVDGTSRTTPYNANWTAGSQHTINTNSPQSGGSGTRYVFSSWSDGGGQSHTVTTPSSAITYTATFSTQYYLTMAASPSGGGTVSPASGWKNKGQSIPIDATVNSGYTFGSWTGTGTGSYTGTTKSRTITMNGPIGETANFNVIQSVLTVVPLDRAVSSGAGTTTFSVVNAGAGTMNWTAISDQLWAEITDGASGSNNGTITVSYGANVTVNTRIANITVTAPGALGSPLVVTVSQSPASVPGLTPDTTSVSDDFSGSELDAGLWTFVNPLGDVTLSVRDKELLFAVPGVIKHEPWTSGNTAPRVLQEVDPSMNVNTWTVRFNTLPAGSAVSIPMEGIFFEQDSLNYVRVDIFSDGTSIYAFAAGFLTGPANPNSYFSVPIPATSPPVWICVTRSGTLWRVYISLDGVTSFLAGDFEHLMQLRRVGIFAGNAGSAPQEFNCVVDYFQGALPAKPFPTTPDSGASGVARPVIFAWDSTTAASVYRLQVAADPGFGTIVFDSVIVETSTAIDAFQPSQECWWRVRGGNVLGWGEFSEIRPFTIFTTGVDEADPVLERFSLEQNYPNPFNPKTGVRFEVPGVSNVKLVVYDMLGREVAVLVNERKTPGSYQVTFDASGLASGVYVYRLIAGSYVESRKMIFMK